MYMPNPLLLCLLFMKVRLGFLWLETDEWLQYRHKVTKASVSIDTSKQLRVSNTVSLTGHFTQTLGTTLFFRDTIKVAFASLWSAALIRCLVLLAALTCALMPECTMSQVRLPTPNCT